MKAKVIPLVVGALATVRKGLAKESRSNDKCRVASEDCTPRSTHTWKSTRV